MKIVIVGSGASGIFNAILIKKYHPNYEVTLIDKNKIIGKKLLATGNGRCNIGNDVINSYSYNNSLITHRIKEFKNEKYIQLLEELGIYLKNLNGLYYPVSLSSKVLVNYLKLLLNKYKINLLLEEVIDYSSNLLFLKNSKIKFDKLIFALGNGNLKSFGNDLTNFNIFKKHNYLINEIKPGLTPLKTKENVKSLENIRVKCLAKLYFKEELIYEENGEIIFKKDGLSGISIFNISSIIQRKNLDKNLYHISLDLFPNETHQDLINKFKKSYLEYKNDFLNSLFNLPLVNYLLKLANNDFYKFLKISKNLEFKYDSSYDFSSSQVAIGGISLNEINDNFESKKEKNIYFIGEMLDVDGLCGGYNLMFAIYSSYIVALNI